MNSRLTFASNNKIIFSLNSHAHAHRRNIKISTFTKSSKTLASERKMGKHTNVSRFKKHTNLVESNKLNLQRMTFSPSHLDTSSPSSSLKKGRKKELMFLPKTQQDFFKDNENVEPSHLVDRFSSPEVNLGSSSNLQSILWKNDMKKHRNLLSYNILHLQKKYNFSRFELHTLYSMFHALLSDAKWSLPKFKRGFEVMFNMSKIALRPQTLQNIFREQKTIDFQSFIDMYSKIDQTIYRQSIVDYVQILFQGVYHKDKISFQDIVCIMKNRITEKQSIDIAKIVFEGIERKEEETVTLAEIYRLCHHCDSFAKKMYRLYTRECKNQ